jgi:phosphoribosyl 1,2-cyclic phosphodiesterase
VKLVFLGTRGEIDLRTRRHRRHSVLLVSRQSRNVVFDWGLDWLGRFGPIRPDAIVLTHAHPDHAGGLREGAPCPVYATAESWRALARWGIESRRTIEPRARTAIEALEVEAFPVEHSLRAPAVAYRIAAGSAAVVYAPDVLDLPSREQALREALLYVGDGASVVRTLARTRDGSRIGHASIRTQLDWCAVCGVERAFFTHCGSGILRDELEAARRVAELGRERGVEAALAYDGLVVTVQP